MFHDRHPQVTMAINVTRHPFSFRGERSLDVLSKDDNEEEVIYTDTISLAARKEKLQKRASSPFPSLQRLGDAASISFDIDRTPYYNPLDSQRSLQWAARFSRQEEFMEILSRNHFIYAMSASRRENILRAIADVEGLNNSV